jgi:hypothetical protein
MKQRNQEAVMETLNVKRLGFALGTSLALIYLGCILVMMTVPREAAVRFFNSLTHLVDLSLIIRWEMAWWEMAVGVLQVFILGWLLGAMIASFYNISGRSGGERA